MLDEELHDRPLDLPDDLVDCDAVGASPLHCVHEFPINIELELPECRISDPHWGRSLVTWEPVDFEFSQATLAGRSVHDLQLFGITRSRAPQPSQPALRLVTEARFDEGVQSKGGITDPAIAVIPIPDAPNGLRKRCRGSGDNAARWSVGKALKGDERPQRQILPFAMHLLNPVAPLLPEVGCLFQRPSGVEYEGGILV